MRPALIFWHFVFNDPCLAQVWFIKPAQRILDELRFNPQAFAESKVRRPGPQRNGVFGNLDIVVASQQNNPMSLQCPI